MPRDGSIATPAMMAPAKNLEMYAPRFMAVRLRSSKTLLVVCVLGSFIDSLLQI